MSEQIELKGLDEINRRLANLKYRRPMLERIGQKLVSDFQLGFRQGVAPDGSKWLPLKIRKGQPLVDKGLLRRSITPSVTDDQLEIGTNLKYARLHQYGGVIKPKKGKYLKFAGRDGNPVFVKKVTIPARPFLGLEERQVKKINRALQVWVEKQLNG